MSEQAKRNPSPHIEALSHALRMAASQPNARENINPLEIAEIKKRLIPSAEVKPCEP